MMLPSNHNVETHIIGTSKPKRRTVRLLGRRTAEVIAVND